MGKRSLFVGRKVVNAVVFGCINTSMVYGCICINLYLSAFPHLNEKVFFIFYLFLRDNLRNLSSKNEDTEEVFL